MLSNQKTFRVTRENLYSVCDVSVLDNYLAKIANINQNRQNIDQSYNKSLIRVIRADILLIPRIFPRPCGTQKNTYATRKISARITRKPI